jgi:hypothetical protein
MNAEEVVRTKMRCRWCGLSRGDCCCDSPDFEKHGRCQSCACWYPSEKLADANDISEPERIVCPDCYATDTDRTD